MNSSGTLELTATQDGGTNNSMVYSAAAPVTHQITVRPHSKANYLQDMRDNTNYSTRLTKFQNKYSGKTNPDTGSAYTNAELVTLFESDDGDPDGDGMLLVGIATGETVMSGNTFLVRELPHAGLVVLKSSR